MFEINSINNTQTIMKEGNHNYQIITAKGHEPLRSWLLYGGESFSLLGH